MDHREPDRNCNHKWTLASRAMPESRIQRYDCERCAMPGSRDFSRRGTRIQPLVAPRSPASEDAVEDASERARRSALVALAGDYQRVLSVLLVPKDSLEHYVYERITAAQFVAGAILRPTDPELALTIMVERTNQERVGTDVLRAVANAYADSEGLPRPYP